MPVLSVLTALACDRGSYLEDTAASLSSQRLPDGWDLEWVVVEDGFTPTHQNLPGPVPWTYTALNRQLGAATARSVALHQSRGDWITCLDEDDVYEPGALATLISHFEHGPWVGGGFRRFSDDTDLTDPVMPLVPAGPVAVGAVTDYWRTHGAFPFLATGVAYQRRLLLEVGGWPAVPRSEDAALLALVNQRHAGYSIHAPILQYRQHPSQNTRQSWAAANKLLAQRMTLSYVDHAVR